MSILSLFSKHFVFLSSLGSEFVDPQPESTNHFSGIHVYHVPSGVVHVDDTINVILGVMAFHPTLVTVGMLYFHNKFFALFISFKATYLRT